MTLEEVVFNLNTLLAEVCTLAESQLENKPVELIKKIPSLPESYIGDPVKLRQILLNLVGNACKFTEKGKIFLTLSVVQESDKTATIQFSLQDSGIGIDERKLKNIFSPFSQGDKDITRRFGGTGLGLSISKNMAELMGGQINVQSKKGDGSTFHVTLPLKKVHSRAKKPLVEKKKKTLWIRTKKEVDKD
ncbi:MAG: ATP-binding protein, partial [Nitrospinota bacterium]